MISKQYKSLCIKEITGNISENEKLMLEHWLSGSNNNKKEFEKLKSIWIDSKLEDLPETIDLEMEWTKLNEKLRIFEENRDTKKSFMQKLLPSGNILLPKLKPAIAGIFILFLAAVGIYLINNGPVEPELNVFDTSNKEFKNVQLPDGSTVFLNSGSTIKYYSESNGDKGIFYDGERKVLLNGEAFFSVVKNSSPFIITTENAKITVLGTKFDVLSRDENTRVVVKEGKVNFSKKNIGAEGLYLMKDELSVISKNSEPTTPKKVDAAYFLKWMKGDLVFYRTNLNDIVGDLERRYNINISLSKDSLRNYTLTGSFKNSNADSALSMICLALGLDYEKQNNNYIIKMKK